MDEIYTKEAEIMSLAVISKEVRNAISKLVIEGYLLFQKSQ